jgi:tetratricopeptide (TPR) repeat protein
LDALEEGLIGIDDLTLLSPGLAGFYHRMFSRRFPDFDRYCNRYGSLLSILAAARAPLPLPLLARASGLELADARQRLLDLNVYLHVSAGRQAASYALFHRSLAEWLSRPEDAGRFSVDEAEGHRRLADVGWAEFEDGVSQMSPYARDNLAAHLLERRSWERLLTVICSEELALPAAWTRQGQIDIALRCLDELIRHAPNFGGTPSIMVKLAIWRAQISSRHGDYEKAERSLEDALAWRDGVEVRERAIALHEMGSLQLYRGNYAEAASAYREALQMCWTTDPPHRDEASANLVGLATVELERFNLDNALVLGTRSAEEAERGHDSHHRIASLAIVAAAQRGLGQYDNALATIEMARVACNAPTFADERVRLLLLEGWVRYDQSILDGSPPLKAVKCLENGLEAAERATAFYNTLEAKLSLAWLDIALGRDSGWLRDVEAMLPTEQHLRMWAGFHVCNAAKCQQDGNRPNALLLYESAVEFCSEHGAIVWLCRALAGYGSMLAQLGRMESAESAWQESVRLAGTVSRAKRKLAELIVTRCRASPKAPPR